MARERTNLQPKKMDVLVGAFSRIRFVSAGWLYLLHLDLWMYGEREGITLYQIYLVTLILSRGGSEQEICPESPNG